MQTLVTQVQPGATGRSSRAAPVVASRARVPCRPGRGARRAAGASSKVWSGRTRRPLAQRTGSARSAIVTTRSPSCAAIANTSQGPAKSSSSASSNSRIPVVIGMLRLLGRTRVAVAEPLRGTRTGRRARRGGTRGAWSRRCRSRSRAAISSTPARRTPRAGAARPRPGPLDVAGRRHAGLGRGTRARSGAGSSRRARRARATAGRRRGGRRSRPAARRARRGRRPGPTRWLLNCDCPPGRLRNTTSSRATAAPARGRGPPRRARARGRCRR